jgi:hypothetical protein
VLDVKKLFAEGFDIFLIVRREKAWYALTAYTHLIKIQLPKYNGMCLILRVRLIIGEGGCLVRIFQR